jgi:hypothetical protein
MPTSDFHQISDVLHVIEQLQPRTVLDIGVGFGKWGILCREILEIYKGRVTASTWEIQIDGVEINEPYRNPLWELAYDHVYCGDVAEVLPTLASYDLIICCDVIEHFEKETGHSLLRDMLRQSKVTILTSPRGFAQQGARHGNEYERHRSGWGIEDFRQHKCLYKNIGFTFLAVLSSDPTRLANIQLLHPLQVLGVKKGSLELARLAAKRARQRWWPATSPKPRSRAASTI